MFDIASIGNLSIDSILLPNRKAPVVILGGSAAYVSLAAKRLDARVTVVSKVGSDFPAAYRWWLGEEGIDLSGLTTASDEQTTRFELTYNDDLSDRVMCLMSKCSPITTDDVPGSLKALAVHVAPIADELSYEVVKRLKKCADVLSFDPQGLVRGFGSSGSVVQQPLANREVLGLVDIYKSSATEIESVTGLSDPEQAIKEVHDHGAKIVIVTLGARGSIVSFEGSSYNVPACTPAKVVDPTGAGDAFMGGFLAEYVNDASVLRCACVGSAAASFAVEGVGPTSLKDKAPIYERARQLYEKEIKELCVL